jgi:hypothetical protein
MVRNELGRPLLSDLGEAMAAARKGAPSHPHPRSPDTPPGNVVVGMQAGIVDRICDTVNGLAQGYVTAVGDVIAIVLRRQKPRVSPTGSKVTRTTATQVRSVSSDTTEAAIEAIRTAKHIGERSLHTAGATKSLAARANGTARVAKRRAPHTARTAEGTAAPTQKSTNRAVASGKRRPTTATRTARSATTA